MTGLLMKLFLKNCDPTTVKGREKYGRVAGLTGIVCNALLSIFKLVVGIIANSISITADAVNNISDAGSSVVTLIGFRISGKPADRDHPYGHARMEYVTGLIISFIILIIGFSLGKSSVEKIITPEQTDFSNYALIVLGVSVVVKLWMMTFNNRLGKAINSTALAATAEDSRNDAVSTLAVLVSSLISRFTGFSLDAYMGVVISVFILISGYKLVRETIDPLLGEAPDKEMYNSIIKRICDYEGVLGVHDLLVHTYGPNSFFASAHVEVSADMDIMKSHDLADQIERDFHSADDIHLSVHIDPIVTGDTETVELRQSITEQMKEYDTTLTLHDFRIVRGTGYTNVLFDVVVPPESENSDSAVKEKMCDVVKALGTEEMKYYPVINIDHSYGVME